MDLKEQIKNYYFEHLDQLPDDKRFHFASRIAAWDVDERSIAVLSDLKSYISFNGNIRSGLTGILNSPVRKVYGYEVRKPYFDKYPGLFGAHDALFRVRHLKEIYGIDAREELLELAGAENLRQLYAELLEDSSALRALSRFGIDYLMLYEILYEMPERVSPQIILELAGGYDSADAVQCHLMVYLFTHAIIADSFFYARPIPSGRIGIYSKMLMESEKILTPRKDIKLDTCFEFLVAGRICGYSSPLYGRIISLASENISPKGTFIIDPLNGGPEAGINSVARSEHRNVLYIMANSGYSPRPVLLR